MTGCGVEKQRIALTVLLFINKYPEPIKLRHSSTIPTTAFVNPDRPFYME
jgi:hypothetical protein